MSPTINGFLCTYIWTKKKKSCTRSCSFSKELSYNLSFFLYCSCPRPFFSFVGSTNVFWELLRLCLLFHICLLVLEYVWRLSGMARLKSWPGTALLKAYLSRNVVTLKDFCVSQYAKMYNLLTKYSSRNENWIMRCRICFVTWKH